MTALEGAPREQREAVNEQRGAYREQGGAALLGLSPAC